jgi:chemotaxis protein methyltransferase CheR
MTNDEVENIEISLLLEAMFQRYGHDFRNYARTSITRRINQFLINSDYASVSEMIPRLLRDESICERLVNLFSITVTEMFRDPLVYRSLREEVFPLLRTYPFVKIWHAGCATGEEVYSLAIALKEESLYDRATIFATDFNDAALNIAREGIYTLENIKQFTKNYQKAGGTSSFSEYYHAHYDHIAICQSLRENITFANHNLTTDGVFGEMHLIMCRNVLIYMDKALQNRALKLFRDSLIYGGFLCLGSAETLDFSEVHEDYRTINKSSRIYQKKSLSGRTLEPIG